MIDLQTAKECVLRGVALLDERHEGWREKIDLETLQMWNGDCCVLGQFYDGRYAEGIGVLFGIWGVVLSDEEFDKTTHYGFSAWTRDDYAILQQAWLNILSEEE